MSNLNHFYKKANPLDKLDVSGGIQRAVESIARAMGIMNQKFETAETLDPKILGQRVHQEITDASGKKTYDQDPVAYIDTSEYGSEDEVMKALEAAKKGLEETSKLMNQNISENSDPKEISEYIQKLMASLKQIDENYSVLLEIAKTVAHEALGHKQDAPGAKPHDESYAQAVEEREGKKFNEQVM